MMKNKIPLEERILIGILFLMGIVDPYYWWLREVRKDKLYKLYCHK